MISLAILAEVFTKGASVAIATYALWREYRKGT